MFVFYVFNPSPMLFNRVHDREMTEGARAADYRALERQFEEVSASRTAAAAGMARADASGDDALRSAAEDEFQRREKETREIRGKALMLIRETTKDAAYSDVNYVFPTFIATQLPIGLVGLLIAAIFAAAMSTISAELSALSTATVIDFYRRFVRPNADDRHFLRVSRFATAFWGLFATAIGIWAAELGSLIEVVNRFGSYFYGSILGVFILAIAFPRATPTGAFVGLIGGMACVGLAATFTKVEFLWHNVTGAVAVVIVGLAVSAATSGTRGRA
jgi:Na+(H+)/acetate symporter ActP